MTIHNLHLKPQVFTRKAFNSVSFFKQETRKSFFLTEKLQMKINSLDKQKHF